MRIEDIVKLIRLPLPKKIREILILSRLGLKVLVITDPMSEKLEAEIKKIGNVKISKPTYGRFDPYAPVAAQIREKTDTLLSYDIILIMRDLPKKGSDKRMAEYVLFESKTNFDKINESINKSKKITPLFSKLMDKKLVNYYIITRQIGIKESLGHHLVAILITPNQLNPIKNMAIAYAKLRLSTKVQREDLEKAINLYEYLLRQVGFDF